MNEYAKRIMRDGRNPYGARGGHMGARRARRPMREEDYGRRRDYGYDYGDEEECRLEKRDVKDWEKSMINEDGSRGFHWTKEQIEQVAKNMGIDHKEFGEHAFYVAMNMMYSDYCNVAKKFGVDRPEYYAELAKAFLKDKDFDGDGAEKLALYYHCIVKEDEE